MSTITRWSRFPMLKNGHGGEPFAIVADDLNRLLRTIPTGPVGSSVMPTTEAVFRPRVDFEEFEDRFVLTAELPGLSISDVDVEVEPEFVRLSGKKVVPEAPEDEATPDSTVLVCERRWGEFERSVRLPRAVVQAKAKASMKNGLLTIELPFETEKPRVKKLTIQAG